MSICTIKQFIEFLLTQNPENIILAYKHLNHQYSTLKLFMFMSHILILAVLNISIENIDNDGLLLINDLLGTNDCV